MVSGCFPQPCVLVDGKFLAAAAVDRAESRIHSKFLASALGVAKIIRIGVSEFPGVALDILSWVLFSSLKFGSRSPFPWNPIPQEKANAIYAQELQV